MREVAVIVTVDCTLPQLSSSLATQPHNTSLVGQPLPTYSIVSLVDSPQVWTVSEPPSGVAGPRSSHTTAAWPTLR